ncbi:hypothetical protein ma849 [Moumouvirus australiensis]|uniref:Uncharacterized protein n=1 Tax=Moumouvirus australiensis TaxID=2109587 RepID=A0A2P1EMV1_9VIRU|nr:hypothetical protein QKC55_gp055 [Moumouvirus australiensis]AVL95236.1 hypothetical protein ma849 [Moumouvirus australiensis]
MDLEKINREFILNAIIKDVKYLNEDDLEKIKSVIEKRKQEINEEIFFSEFNKMIPNILNNKIKVIKFVSTFYGKKSCSNIIVQFDEYICLKTNCTFKSDDNNSDYDSDNSDYENNDINKLHSANRKITFGICGKFFDIEYLTEESAIKKLKEKHKKTLFDHFSIKLTNKNIEIFDEFINNVINIMMVYGEQNKKSMNFIKLNNCESLIVYK